MAVLDERHHTFLQALMKRGPLLEDESKSMHKELFGISGTSAERADEFFNFLATVNRELDYLSMEVRGSKNQYNGQLYYGLVNKLANEEAKVGTRLTHPQLTFFKAIVESILTDPTASGSIRSLRALNLRLDTQTEIQAEASSSQAPVALKLTLAAKEETLASLVESNWLDRTEDGHVCLGTRSFLELRSFFKNFDVPFCEVCNEAAIKAQLCQNEDCTVRIHSYCEELKFARRQVPKVCPSCRTPWRMASSNGRAASASDQDNEVDEEDEGARVSTPAARPLVRRASQRRKAKLQESPDDEHGNDDDESQEGPSSVPSQPSSQARRVIHSRAKMKARR